MPKFLLSAKYTAPDGVRGLITEGGSARERAVTEMVAGHGGTTECFYYQFGEEDAFAIVDLPDANTAAAIALAIGASGRATVTTTLLLTSADLDEASRIEVNYRGPGQISE